MHIEELLADDPKVKDQIRLREDIYNGRYSFTDCNTLNSIINDFTKSIRILLYWLPKEWQTYSNIKSFATDKYSITKHLKKYNITLDNINKSDFEIIKQYLFNCLIAHIRFHLDMFKMETILKNKHMAKAIVNSFLSSTYNIIADISLLNKNTSQNKILVFIKYNLKSFLYEIDSSESPTKKRIDLKFRNTHNKSKNDKRNTNTTTTIKDIWMLEFNDDIRNLNYINVFDNFLKKNGFYTEVDGKYKWKHFKGKSINKAYAALLKVLDQKGYIKLEDFRNKSPELKDIIENTFSHSFQTSKAFRISHIYALMEYHTEDLKLIPDIILDKSSLRAFL